MIQRNCVESRGRLCLLAVAFLTGYGAAQQAGSSAVPPADDLSKAREKLHSTEAAHPGNTLELAQALHDLVAVEIGGDSRDSDYLALAEREVAVALASGGARSSSYALALADDANALTSLSRASDARPLAEHAFEISQKEPVSAEDGIAAADALSYVCNALGDFPCSLRADEAAIALERKPGPDHEWLLADTLSAVGDVKEQMGDTAGAGAAIEESLVHAMKAHPDDPQIAIIEANLGAYYLRNQEFAKAVPHLNRSVQLATSAYGPDSTLVKAANSNLADIYTRTGQFPLAWKSYELAIANPTETVDRLARLHANYARSLASGGKLAPAIEQGLLAAQISRKSFVLQARTLPERQALAYAENRPRGLDTALSVLIRHPELPAGDIYQEMVRSRALVTDEMARRQKNLNANNDPQVARLLTDLNQARADLLAADQATSGKDSAGQAISQATERMEKIERALAEQSAAMRNDERSTAVQLDDLRRNLPSRSVLISYVSYLRVPVEIVDPARASTASYLAFVLHPDSNIIRVFDLGEAKPIEDLVNHARASADAEAHGGGLGSTHNERTWREAAEALRRLIWDPLQPELADARLALVVPDGVLNLIPFSSLPSGKGYLVESGPVIHLLTSERDLVPAEGSIKKTGLLALGSPQFDAAPSDAESAHLRDAGVSCQDFRNLAFHPLPGSRAEVADIESSWRRFNADEPSSMLTGADATRARFMQQASQNRVLHIATHAFLLDRSCGDGNPLLHSGLVFAGANSNRDSAILTAQQVASLDLSGVDWAVLSACNTGNGELRDGEGVLGLERAFRVAGAHSVIMTLWPVDDDVTRQFMHELYAQRLGIHATTADAVWISARKMLQKRRASGLSTHPWYWAGFVGSGGWQ